MLVNDNKLIVWSTGRLYSTKQQLLKISFHTMTYMYMQSHTSSKLHWQMSVLQVSGNILKTDRLIYKVHF